MKIITWNVNGIRAAYNKGFLDWLKKEDADIVCIQETKAHENQLPEELLSPVGYQSFWNESHKKGYAGVAIYTKKEPFDVIGNFKNIKFHEDGRVLEAHYDNFVLFNIYFPNGGMRADGTDMLPYKLEFYDELIEHIKTLRKEGKSVIVCGDYNIAHTEIDIARPEANKNSIGFSPPERAKLSEFFAETGMTDVFRHFNPKEKDAYTWWSFRAGARQRNVGWRLDYFSVSEDLLSQVKSIRHATETTGSDHCPVILDF